MVGASGNVGGATVQALQDHGIPVRAAATSLDRAPTGGEIELVVLDLLRPVTFALAVAGIGGLFLLRPPPPRQRTSSPAHQHGTAVAVRVIARACGRHHRRPEDTRP